MVRVCTFFISADLAIQTQIPVPPGGGVKVIPWMRVVRVTLAWVILISIFLVRYTNNPSFKGVFEWFAFPV